MATMTKAGIGLCCVALAFLSACAARTDTPPAESSASPDLITETQLSRVDAIDAYDAVRQLRPQWFRTRGPASLRDARGTLATVYVDNMRFGELVSLRSIPINGVAEIRYISGPDATTRWGTGVVGGVIEVIRKKG